MEAPEGRKFYGSVTVSERGQIVVPVDARKDFNINAGDRLLVFGDLKTGLWIATLDIVGKMEFGVEFFRSVGMKVKDSGTEAPESAETGK
jgi:AbrB family looped-hinge helix DNA binding protein